MADKKKFEVTAELFLKTSNASKDAKKFADGIRQQLNNIENAADNFTVFQNLIGYIAQADKNLAALIANHKDEFKDMISGLDEGLHNQYEEMFGVSGETLQKLDALREKLAAIKVGAKPEEVRKFVTELNGLFTAIGSDIQLDPSEFSRKITQDMVDKVTAAFGDFEKLFVDKVSNLKNNLNLGGIGIGSFSEDIQKELKGLSDQLSEAKSLKKELESTLSAINKSENGNTIALNAKPTEDFVKDLIKQYNDLEEASKNLINGTDEYYSNLTKRANIGMQLYAIRQRGLEFKGVDISSIVDSEAFSKVLDEVKNKSQEIFANLDQTIQTAQQKVQDFMTGLSSGSGQGGTSTGQDEAIEKDAEEAARTLEYCKSKLTKAFQDYYKAVEKARSQGVDVDAGEISAEMESIRNQIEQTLDNWGIYELDKIVDGKKFNIGFLMSDVLDGITDQEIKPDEIEGKINDLLSGLQINVPSIELLQTIHELEQAVDDKTRAFTEEQSTVDSVVNKEIESLGRLKEYLELLKETAQSIFSGKRQEIEFHAGDLDYYTKTGVRSEALGGSGAALTDGYGAYGTGIYTVSNPNVYLKNKDNWSGAGSKIYAIDTTAYNRFVAQTSEQAEQLYNFLAKLEKFTLASAGFQGFDDELNGVDVNSLYADMQNVFKNTAMPLERFQKFIDDAKQLISMVGIDKLDNIKLGDLNSILGGDNVATQWMRLLGYQGVSVKGTKYDNTTVGSVTYDLDQSNAYIKAFDTIDEAIEFYNQHLTQTNSIQDVINNSVEQWQNGLEAIKTTLNSISGSIEDSSSSMQTMADKLSEMVNNAQALRGALDGTDGVITSNEAEHVTTKVAVPSANSDNATKTVPIGDAIDSADVTTETAQLQNLLDILNQVTNAVNAKTTAFEEEYVTVDAAVQLEIDALNRLKESLMTIQSLIQNIFNGNIVIGDMKTIDNSVGTNTMSTSLSTVEQTLNSIYGVLQGFTGIQAENKNSMQYKGTSPERQTGVQSLNDAANTLNNAASNIIEMIQGPDGVWHVPNDSDNSSNNDIRLADTAQQAENSLIRLGDSAQAAGDKIDKLNSNDVSDILSDGMQTRIDRANKLSQAGMSVTRGTLLPSTDEAFNVRLNGGSYDDAFAVTWRKIASGLESVIDLSHVPDEQQTDYAVQKFNDILSNIANNFSDTNWKNTKVDSNGPRLDWIHFATKDRGDGFSDEITKKVYGTFSNIGTVSSDFIEKILSELISKGFQGNIKIPSDWAGFTDTDQIVGHAVDDRSFQILYDTFNEYLTKGIFERIGSGIDIQYSSGKKDSFTNLLTDIYGAAPGETFTVQEIQSIIQSMQKSGKYGMSSEEILNKYISPVLQQRQNAGGQASDIQNINDGLREQISLQEQASNADKSNNDDTSTIQRENEEYREQLDLVQDINNVDTNLGGDNGGFGGGSSNNDSNGGASSSDGGYALESTLQQTNSILNRIANGSGNNGGRTGGGMNRSHYGAGAMTTAEAKNNALWKTLNGNDKLLQSGKIDAAVQAYTDAFDELKAQYSSFQNSNPTEKQKEGFIEARTNCSNLRQEVERLVKSYNTATTAAKVIDFEPLKNFDNRKNELLEYVQTKFPKAEIGDFNAAYTQLSFTIKNADGSFTNAKASINNLGTAITTTAGEAQKSVGIIGGVIDGFKGKWQQLGSYLSSIFSWRALTGQVKQGVAYVREIDSALTELKKVTDETSETYDKFLQTMSKTASQTGSTVKDLTSSAADWARLNN